MCPKKTDSRAIIEAGDAVASIGHDTPSSNRRFLRFPAEANTIAKISFGKDQNAYNLLGLLYEEAFKGCGIIIVTKNRPLKYERVLLAIGTMRTMHAEIRWVRSLDKFIFQIGLLFIDNI